MVYIIFQPWKHKRPPLELCVQFPQEFICCTVMIIFYKIKLIHSFHKHKMKIKVSIKHGAQSLFPNPEVDHDWGPGPPVHDFR